MRQAALEAQLQPSRSPSPGPLTHVQEEAALRKETISAFHSVGIGNGDEGDLLIPREKTKDEQEQEEEEYRVFLEREVGDLHGIGEVDERKKKREKKVKGVGPKSKEEVDQEFLMKCVNPYISSLSDFQLFPATSSTVVGSINPKTTSLPTKKSQFQNLDLAQLFHLLTTPETKTRLIFRIRPSIPSTTLSKLHTIFVLKSLTVLSYLRSLVLYLPLFVAKIQDVKMPVKSEGIGRRERWRKKGRK